MTEWNDLVDAVKNKNWGTARNLAEAVKTEWLAVREVVLAFAVPGADSQSDTVDAAINELQVVLGDPVDPDAVGSAMSTLGSFLSAGQEPASLPLE